MHRVIREGFRSTSSRAISRTVLQLPPGSILVDLAGFRTQQERKAFRVERHTAYDFLGFGDDFTC